METPISDRARHLPGGDLLERGLLDLRRGELTLEALLISIGGPRLRRLGFDIPERPHPEHDLYNLLAQDDPDGAHSRYNALLRRLVSLERALERESRTTPTG